MDSNQCAFCKHYTGARTCPAFPEEDIPEEIWTDEHDHRDPLGGEEILFDLSDDAPFDPFEDDDDQEDPDPDA